MSTPWGLILQLVGGALGGQGGAEAASENRGERDFLNTIMADIGEIKDPIRADYQSGFAPGGELRGASASDGFLNSLMSSINEENSARSNAWRTGGVSMGRGKEALDKADYHRFLGDTAALSGADFDADKRLSFLDAFDKAMLAGRPAKLAGNEMSDISRLLTTVGGNMTGGVLPQGASGTPTTGQQTTYGSTRPAGAPSTEYGDFGTDWDYSGGGF